MRIPRPRTRKGRVVAVLVVLVVVAAGVGGWLLLREDTAQAQSMTEEVSTASFSQTVTASGTLRAKKSSDVTFAVSGTVTKVLVEAGDTVRQGQMLARVDDENLEAARTAAGSARTAAKTALAEASSGSDGVEVAARTSALAQAEAEADEAEEALADAVLRAPFAGTVTAVDLEVGDRVGTSSGSSGGSASGGVPGVASSATTSTSGSSGSVQVVTTGRFEVDAEVSATDVENVKKGLQVELIVSGVSDTVYGTVVGVGRLASANSSGSAVFPVVVEVTGERNDLYAGTTAEVSIIVSRRSDVLAVSTGAVQRDDEGNFVAVSKDGKEERRTVEVGEASGPSTEIVSGLEEGESVVVPGFSGGGRQDGRQGGSAEMPDMSQMPGFGSGGLPGGGSMQPPAGFDGQGGN